MRLPRRLLSCLSVSVMIGSSSSVLFVGVCLEIASPPSAMFVGVCPEIASPPSVLFVVGVCHEIASRSLCLVNFCLS